MTPEHSRQIIAFMSLAMTLKSVRRQGWIDRGVPNSESSADHSWSLALFAWLIACEIEELDANRILLMALLHDLPEALAGDATPFDRHRNADGKIPDEHFRAAPEYGERESKSKVARERAALVKMTRALPLETREQISGAWEEYVAGETTEARFVRQLDKLETLLQAEIYLDQHPEIVIDSFRFGTDRDVRDSELRAIFSAIRSQNPE